MTNKLELLTIGGQRFWISRKLLALQNTDYIKAPAINSYDIDKTVKALIALGFDLTENRIQGKEIITQYPKHSDQSIEISHSWVTLDDYSVFNGTSSIKLKDRFLDRNITPWCSDSNYNIIRQHEWVRYNNRIARNYKFLPDTLNKVINKMNNKGIALNQHPASRAIMVDIDNHNYEDQNVGRIEAKRILNLLYSHLNYPEEAFIEESYSGGYHIGFLTDSIVSDEDMKQFISDFHNSYGVTIEIRFTTKLFRLPNHFTYTTGYTTRDGDNITFIPFENHISDWKDKVLNTNYRLNYNSIFTPRPAAPKVTKTYMRSRRTNQHSGIMVAGNRDKAMWLIACSMIRSGKSMDDYYDRLCEENISSRDWESWNQARRRSESERCWNNALLYIARRPDYTSYDKPEYISSKSHLSNNILKLIANPLVLSYFNADSDSPYMKVRDRSALDTKHMLEEILGKTKYEDSNPRIAILGSPEYRFHLEQGYQFPRNFIDLTGKTYNMGSSCRKLANYILNNTGLFSLYNWDGKSGRYASTGNITFCRQFVSTNINISIIASFLAIANAIINAHSTPGEYNKINTTNHGYNMCEIYEECNLEVKNQTDDLFRSPPD